MFAAVVLTIPLLAQTLPATMLFDSNTFNSYGFNLAADGTNLYNATYNIININKNADGTEVGDIEYTVYDENFSITDHFTLKGLYINAIKEENGHEYKYNVSIPYQEYPLGYDIPYIILTKGVFTTDGKWCAIIQEYSGNRETKCFTVYKQDNSKVGEFTLSIVEKYGNKEMLSPHFVFGKPLSGKVYVAEYDEYKKMTVYSFTDQNGLLTPTVLAKTAAAWPNPLPQGSPLTIELGREASHGTFVTFSDMRGRLVDRIAIGHGETIFTVTPRSLSRGAYIYTVYFGDGEVVAGKLISE